MMEARILPEFAALYPALDPGRWYPVSERGIDSLRPGGPSSSGGGPTSSAGLWLGINEQDQFVFRRHVEVRETLT